MITDDQLAEFETQGAVTIDGPFTDEEIDRAEAAWDRIQADGRPAYEEPAYVDVLQHPGLEALACKVLRARAAHLWWGLKPHNRGPVEPPWDSAREQWSKGCHTDIQVTWSDFTATPRRTRAELWLWLNDVPEDRGAMRILPGSHRPIMEWWDSVLTQEHKAQLPRVHGQRPSPVSPKAPAFPEHVPDLTDTPWIEQEPVPYTARRGQVLVLCSAALHSAWQNQDDVPRKSMPTSWIAGGVRGGLPANQRDDVLSFFPELRARLLPERAHIVPDDFDWLFESGYDPTWPELAARDGATD
jgi:hypothetical protein